MKTRLLGPVALGLSLVTGCASGYEMVRADIVPAADGSIEAKVADNGNVALAIVVDHLAPPGRIAPNATVYVVWATPAAEGGTAQNVGALRLDGKLKGKLKTVTPHRDFTVTVTPEASPEVQVPTGPAVLSRRITIK